MVRAWANTRVLVRQAVEAYLAQQQQQQEADEESQAEQLPDPNAGPGDAYATHAGVPLPRRSAAGSIVMPSPSLRANASLAANSYHEALAASLRSHTGTSYQG
jgi:hypothetical protein